MLEIKPAREFHHKLFLYDMYVSLTDAKMENNCIFFFSYAQTLLHNFHEENMRKSHLACNPKEYLLCFPI